MTQEELEALVDELGYYGFTIAFQEICFLSKM